MIAGRGDMDLRQLLGLVLAPTSRWVRRRMLKAHI